MKPTLPHPRKRPLVLDRHTSQTSEADNQNGVSRGAELTFVLCAERGVLERQVLFLCDSIRRFAGRYRDSQIVAVSPRKGREMTAWTKRRLEALFVDVVEGAINTECLDYGPANKVYAAAHVAKVARSEVLVLLDSDTVFLDEPDFTLADADVAVRPVDVKGMTSTGPGDAADTYWRNLCEVCAVDYAAIPFVETTVDQVKVKASYNGGLTVIRRASGIYEKCADFFTRSIRAGLRPYKGRRHRVHASDGYVGQVAAEHWGSVQAVLSLAIWSTTRNVKILDNRYNVPLHKADLLRDAGRLPSVEAMIHVHYHYCFNRRFMVNNYVIRHSDLLEPDRLSFLRQYAPLDRWGWKARRTFLERLGSWPLSSRIH